jgi:ABC-type dipeptide/oligopeptide/nickel transport system permease component
VQSFGTILVALTVNFLIFRLLPGNAADDFARVPGATPELQESLRRQFGLDGSLWSQYVAYVKQLLHGNLGVSFQSRQPVTHDLGVALGHSLPMVLAGTLVGIGLGITAGAVAAWRRSTTLDRVATGSGLVLYALPAQFLGLVLIILFHNVLPIAGMQDEFAFGQTTLEHLKDVGRHMILPATTLGLIIFGNYVVLTRAAVLDTLGQEYVLAARSRGFRDPYVLQRYALRNAALPITHMVALSLGFVVAGSILIETVFSWPGIGYAVFQAVLARDYPMLQGAFLTLAVAVIGFNLCADLVSMRLDRRVVE